MVRAVYDVCLKHSLLGVVYPWDASLTRATSTQALENVLDHRWHLKKGDTSLLLVKQLNVNKIIIKGPPSKQLEYKAKFS